jgi:hypothetical protein
MEDQKEAEAQIENKPWTTGKKILLGAVILAIIGGIGTGIYLIVAYRKRKNKEAAEKQALLEQMEEEERLLEEIEAQNQKAEKAALALYTKNTSFGAGGGAIAGYSSGKEATALGCINACKTSPIPCSGVVFNPTKPVCYLRPASAKPLGLTPALADDYGWANT